MKKFSVLLLLSALACSSAAPPTAPRPAASVNTVNVAIESRPDSAEIYVAGKFIGTTPMVARLLPGDHAIEVRHPERAAWKRELTVLPDSPARVMALLTRAE
jgi:PEGA domain